jgi:anti-anti-sigma factor
VRTTSTAEHPVEALRAQAERIDPRTVRIRLSGTLDWVHADSARRVVDTIRDDPPQQLVIDATAVDECDATGIAVVTAACFRVRTSGGSAVVRASPAVQRTVERCRLGRYLHVERRTRPGVTRGA